MNDVKLFGYLGREFDTDYTPSGICYARNSLAITEKWKNKKGNEESKTTWIPIVLFGKNAENGSKKTFLSVIVSRFYWIGKKSEMVNEQKEKSNAQIKQTPKKEEVPNCPKVDYLDSQAIETEQEEVPF